jgi:glycosyltransferase involved in cell wall biosynthesis
MPFLSETLASIEAQSYRNWKVLAWDAGSTDGSSEELHKWIPCRLPGRLVTNHPLSLGASLAQMVEMADTEFCARIDADDVNLPDRLEKQVEYLQHHPEVAVLGGQMRYISADGQDKGPYFPLPLTHEDIVLLLLFLCPLAHPSVMFRRSAVLNAGNYRDFVAEDYELWLRMAVHFRFANLPDRLVNYRIHEKSAFSQLTSANRSESTAMECLCLDGPMLFGCSASSLKTLRERNHACAAWALLKILWHLQRRQGGSFLRRVYSEVFLFSLNALMRPNDYISKIIRRLGNTYYRFHRR